MELRNLLDFFNSLPRDIDGNTEVNFINGSGTVCSIDVLTMKLDSSGCFTLQLQEE